MACSEQEREEIYLRSLNEKISEILSYKYNVSEEEIAIAVAELIDAVSPGQWNFSKIDFNNPANVCAYLKRYAACHAGLTRSAALEFLYGDNESYMGALGMDIQRLFPSNLNIVSIGGGLGNDLIGMTSALFEDSQFCPRNINWTIVEIAEGWNDPFFISFSLLSGGSYGIVSNYLKNYKIIPKFIKCDITKTSNCVDHDLPGAIEAIRAADLVLIVKVLSIVEPYEKRKDILKAVLQEMGPNAIFLCIDTGLHDVEAIAQDCNAATIYFTERKSYFPLNFYEQAPKKLSYEIYAAKKQILPRS